MPLIPGVRLGPYEIVGALGVGGMGEVYKARDTRLDRFVALKVLGSAAALTASARARLLEEARSASALNHPAIVTFHDILTHDGMDVLVMELVAGQSLADVIAAGPLDIRRALRLASQLADALATAHAAGIIHRDLKPSNIMVTPDDRLKLLDFGLAKAMPANPQIGATRTALTTEGTIVGTLAYMSPEQAEGRPLDARSDIFSFGAVLYELMTGRRAFVGESSAATLSAVLRDDPPAPSTFAKQVPPEIDRLIARCLRKDPARRFQSMADVRAAIDDARMESDATRAAAPAPRRRILAAGAMLLVAAGLLTAGWLATRQRSASLPAFRTTPLTSDAGIEAHPALSPDGRQFAYIADAGVSMEFDLYVKLLAGGEPLRLTETPAAEWSPAWSPNGGRIAFYRMVDSAFGPVATTGKAELITMSALGGDERKLADVLLVFDRTFGPAGLSELVPLVAWLDDFHVAYVSASGPASPADILVTSLRTGESWPLTQSSPAYAGDGCLFYSREQRALYFARDTAGAQSTLFRLPLTQAFRPVGDPERLETGVSFALSPIPDAANGGLLFVESADQVKWLVRGGGQAELVPLRGARVMQLASAPAGNRLAYVAVTRTANMFAWNANSPGPLAPVSPSSSLNYAPAYSPDGSRIAFVTRRMGPVEIWEAARDGTGARAIVSFPAGMASYPDWSPDGRRIAFFANPKGNWDLFLANPDGGAVQQLTSGPETDYMPRWSRDGQWIYFARRPDLWRVRPDGTGAQQIIARATHAQESVDGRTLYFARYAETPGAAVELDLWSRPVQGGNETRLVRGISDERDFAVGARGLYFLRVSGREASELGVYEFATRRERILMTLPKLPQAGLALAPDESGGLLVLAERPQSDIMLAERIR